MSPVIINKNIFTSTMIIKIAVIIIIITAITTTVAEQD